MRKSNLAPLEVDQFLLAHAGHKVNLLSFCVQFVYFPRDQPCDLPIEGAFPSYSDSQCALKHFKGLLTITTSSLFNN